MLQLTVKPGDKLVKGYYEVLGQLGQLHIDHEMAVRSAFQNVLTGYSKKLRWTVVPEFPIKTPKGRIAVDAAVLDSWTNRRGFWEAKDEHDDLEKEIKLKIGKGYPTSNIIFQSPERAILFQHGVRQGLNEDIRDGKNLSELLNNFFAYTEPDHEEWEAAVAEFKERLPEIAKRAEELINKERRTNKQFIQRFEAFYALCRQALNPNLSAEAVEKMLIQHLLTERIFRRVFENEEFRTQNVIAAEIEKVISALVLPHGSRDRFLADLNRFYKAIERSAEDKTDYGEKQDFLNTVYERFFQGYSPKEADTHGIVYTPQPIVDFMVRSVEDILKKEFGRSLSDKGVHVLDPFVGTGNFITRIMREIKKSALPYKYEHELHCNEVMLMPYYIASMNIAHQYQELTGDFKEFPGICLVDTFELAEPEQATLGFMTEENTARVKRQKESPIFVAIGNPPYNTQQLNANEGNANRKYLEMDARVQQTYAASSKASLRNKLSDPYVKAFRFATDRIGDEGVVCFVTNGGFIDQVAFDGMRKHLGTDFSSMYVLDLGGNVRKNPKLSGTTHNVFGIQVGVAITLLIRKRKAETPVGHIYYARTVEDWTREQKFRYLREHASVLELDWAEVHPDRNSNWINDDCDSDYESFIPLVDKNNKGQATTNAVFRLFSLGVATNRDQWVYAHSKEALLDKVQRTIEAYMSRMTKVRSVLRDTYKVSGDDAVIKWTDRLLEAARENKLITLEAKRIAPALYRPFSKRFLYFDSLLVHRRYQQHHIFPTHDVDNTCICLNTVGSRTDPSPIATGVLPDLHVASSDGFQCFPFYTYDEDGSNRRENINDWALNDFRTHYNDKAVTKWDIFHYTYALLHHPDYRTRYAANLKRELPRIPYAPDFRAFVKAGERLADLHVNYEKQPEYPLEKIENPSAKGWSWRVEKMRLGKDKTSLFYNEHLTLSGIPPETYEYRLGNRSALDWVIDQYQVSTDKRSGIKNDPNRADDPEYILRLIGQVIYVSVETVNIVRALPTLALSNAGAATAAGRRP
ncbi:MAG TPA: type ISP restriction/modification enzyme [Candidatus Nanoarchaeia archaeon]|nr:type ISP restriction/modification enzyme [Candidatus Nanoarchaeia archaeon]